MFLQKHFEISASIANPKSFEFRSVGQETINKLKLISNCVKYMKTTLSLMVECANGALNLKMAELMFTTKSEVDDQGL